MHKSPYKRSLAVSGVYLNPNGDIHMKNYEDLYNHIRYNIKTADYCEYDCEVGDWDVTWVGSGELTIDVTPDGVSVESIDGERMEDMLVIHVDQLEHLLRHYEPEQDESECVTADDIRTALRDHHVLSKNMTDMLHEEPHEQFIQRILNAAQVRKAKGE